MVWEEEFESVKIDKLIAGTVVYPSNGRCGPRYQEGLQLVLLHTGSMDLYINDKLTTVIPGHVVLLKPGALEDFRFDRESNSCHSWIQLIGNDWSPFLLAFLDCLPEVISLSDTMNRLVNLIISLTEGNKETGGGTATCLGKGAFLLYVDEVGYSRNAKSIHPAVLNVKGYIAGHYDEPITLQQLADFSSLSKEYLIRTFVKETGTTPIRYLWRYRMKRGLELLRNTGFAVEEISYRTGYTSIFHFSKSIKQRTGLSPLQYRHEAWKLR